MILFEVLLWLPGVQNEVQHQPKWAGRMALFPVPLVVPSACFFAIIAKVHFFGPGYANTHSPE